MSSGDLKIPKEIKFQDLRDWVVSKLNIPSFYSQFIQGSAEFHQVSGDGWSNRVLCPLHGDQSSPNFFINFKTGNFKCMACDKGGSVFSFWLWKNGFHGDDKSNFVKGLVEVARHAGINIEDYVQQYKKGLSSGKLPEELHAAKTEMHLRKQEMKKRAPTDELDANEKPIPNGVIDDCVKALRAEHIKYLVTVRGLTKATIDENHIGYMVETQPYRNKDTGEWDKGRYSLPVPDREGKWRNIRLYSPVAEEEYKMLNYVVDVGLPSKKGYGSPPRLMNLHKLVTGRYKNIVVCEGEFKMYLLQQKFEEEGYQTWLAVCGTHGAAKFEAEWVGHMIGCSIYFCLDCDESGRINSKKHISDHFLPLLSSGKFPSVKNVLLPLTGNKDDKDIPDYFLKHKYTLNDFVKLCTETPDVVGGGVEGDEASVEPIIVDDLNALIRDRRYIDQRVTVPLTVVSTAEQTYHAIRTCSIEACPLMKDGECCQSGAGDTNIPYGHPLFIASCMEREESILGRLKGILCTRDLDHRLWNRIKVAQKKKVVMELYYAHQLMERTSQTDEDENKSVLETCATELAHVQVYLLQSEIPINIEPKGYMATGWVRTHPKTSTAALFIEKMVPIEEDWRKFSMKDKQNQEIIKYLRDDLKTEELMREIIYGVTHIFDSDEILVTVLLTFLSPLYFVFNSTRQRGWINSIIIGDSGVGKSSTYTRFSNWVKAGYWFSALTGSRTGLLFSAKQKGNEWYIAAGDYVQASGQIIAVDEVQVLDREVTRSLGNAIDRGILEVKKVASGRYEARTRAIYIGNPKKYAGDQATLSDFTHGCESLAVMFDPMFIRRNDIAIFCAQEPNKEDRYNAYVDPKMNYHVTNRLSALQMRSLIYWAWTREPRHIKWTDEGTKECLAKATELSRIYGAVDKVPLINPNDFRENLARLAVAYAVLERSIDDDLETLIVKPEHVQTVAAFIDKVYSASSCGLRNYSEEMARINRMDEKEFERIRENIESFTTEDFNSSYEYYRNTHPTLRVLVYARNTKQFTLRECMEVTGLTMNWLRRRIDHLKCLDLLQDFQRGSFMTTRKFNLFMMKWRQDPKVEARLENAKNRLHFETPQELKPHAPKEFKKQTTNGNGHEPAAKPQVKGANLIDDPFASSDPFSDESQV